MATGQKGYLEYPANSWHAGIAILMAIASGACFYCGNCLVAFGVVLIVDLQLLFLVCVAAFRSDGHKKASDLLPSRVPCLMAFSCLALAIVLAFAELYLHSDIEHQNPPKYVACQPSDGCSFKPVSTSTKLKCGSDAVYFSMVTITTLGYGDYLPESRDARRLVMWEMCSGALFLLVGIPLLLCRMSMWEDEPVCKFQNRAT